MNIFSTFKKRIISSEVFKLDKNFAGIESDIIHINNQQLSIGKNTVLDLSSNKFNINLDKGNISLNADSFIFNDKKERLKIDNSIFSVKSKNILLKSDTFGGSIVIDSGFSNTLIKSNTNLTNGIKLVNNARNGGIELNSNYGGLNFKTRGKIKFLSDCDISFHLKDQNIIFKRDKIEISTDLHVNGNITYTGKANELKKDIINVSNNELKIVGNNIYNEYFINFCDECMIGYSKDENKSFIRNKKTGDLMDLNLKNINCESLMINDNKIDCIFKVGKLEKYKTVREIISDFGHLKSFYIELVDDVLEENLFIKNKKIILYSHFHRKIIGNIYLENCEANIRNILFKKVDILNCPYIFIKNIRCNEMNINNSPNCILNNSKILFTYEDKTERTKALKVNNSTIKISNCLINNINNKYNSLFSQKSKKEILDSELHGQIIAKFINKTKIIGNIIHFSNNIPIVIESEKMNDVFILSNYFNELENIFLKIQLKMY